MFTLRKISGDGVELNFFLGKSYTLITQDRTPKEFEESRLLFEYGSEEVYGFISDEGGKTLALFPRQQNYIMVDGKTVDYLKHTKNPDPMPRVDESDEKIVYKLFCHNSPDASEDSRYAVGVVAELDPDNAQVVGYGSNVSEATLVFIEKFNDQQRLGNANGLTIELRSV